MTLAEVGGLMYSLLCFHYVLRLINSFKKFSVMCYNRRLANRWRYVLILGLCC